MNVCAVIPAHNEAETIGSIIQATKKYVDTVFVVDDASEDNTVEVARENGAEVIRHIINRGVGAAQRTAYMIAMSDGFDYIVQLDADGQHDPKYIPTLLLEAVHDCDYDMIIGSRYLNDSYKQYHFVRRAGISFLHL